MIVSDDWHGPIVLGWKGFIERVRIAIEPAVSAGEEGRIYFGSAA